MKKLTVSLLVLMLMHGALFAKEKHDSPSRLRTFGHMMWIMGKFGLGYHTLAYGLDSAYVMQEIKNAQVHYHTLVHDAQDMHQLIKDCSATDDIGAQWPQPYYTKNRHGFFGYMHEYTAHMGLGLIGLGCYLMLDGVLDGITLMRDLYLKSKNKKKKLPKIKIITRKNIL